MSGARDVNPECKGTGALEKKRRPLPLSQLAPVLKQFRQFLLFRLLSMLVFSRTPGSQRPTNHEFGETQARLKRLSLRETLRQR